MSAAFPVALMPWLLGVGRSLPASLFLAGSLLCGLSGALGILIGWGLCVLVANANLPDGFDPPVISPGSIVAAVLVLGAVTLASSLYPAIRASRLDPVSALRYE